MRRKTMNKIKIRRGKPSKEARRLLKALNCPDGECQAYKDAKANNSAYIIEDGWIVRVYADDHREKIKYVGKTDVKLDPRIYEIK